MALGRRVRELPVPKVLDLANNATHAFRSVPSKSYQVPKAHAPLSSPIQDVLSFRILATPPLELPPLEGLFKCPTRTSSYSICCATSRRTNYSPRRLEGFVTTSSSDSAANQTHSRCAPLSSSRGLLETGTRFLSASKVVLMSPPGGTCFRAPKFTPALKHKPAWSVP